MKLKHCLCLVNTTILAVFLAVNPVFAQTSPDSVTLLDPSPRVQINDTFRDQQWYLEAINAFEAWAIAPTSSPREIIVATIDGGIDDSHPDLKDILWQDPDEEIDGQDNDMDGYVDDANGWNFVSDSPDTRPVASADGANWAFEHGTLVSSLIAARGNDDIGMAGMAWKAKIMPLVILDQNGNGETADLAKAIRYAARHRADIINMSLEGDMLDSEVANAILEATAQGVLIVIAAGNGFDGVAHNFNDYELFPACHKGAADQSILVVTATDIDGAKHPSANYGSCVSLAAPGGDIFGARPTYEPDGNHENVSGYGEWSGTSLSAPLVSGVAALLKAKYPDWTGEQLAKRILETAQPFGQGIESAGMGAGILDAHSALRTADPAVYGPWKLYGSNGASSAVIITDKDNQLLYSIPVGNPGDNRSIRTAFVHWDEDRIPEVMVTAAGDERGDWRVYRLDGVLLAAGRVAEDIQPPVLGGLLISTKDINSSARESILLTESAGSRAWLIDPENPKSEPMIFADDTSPKGILAVGLNRPLQSFIILRRGENTSQLYVLNRWILEEGTDVATGNHENLRMISALDQNNRQLLRFTQSGDPSYLVEQAGMMRTVEGESATEIKIWRYLQAPLGVDIKGMEGFLFYDSWPR